MKLGRNVFLFLIFLLALSCIEKVNGIDCDPNCLRCDYSTGKCERCDWYKGWFLKEPDRTECVTCSQDGQIFWSVYCFDCIQNCKVCNNLNSCLKCMPGYYRTCDGKCLTCNIKNCNECEIDLNFCSSGDKLDCNLAPQPVCKKCLSGFYLQNKGKECSSCDTEGTYIEC